MRNVTEELWNSTRSSSLYCVWVPVQDKGRERLAAIWIDRAMTAFTSERTGTAASGQPLLLKSLKSDDVEHTDRVEVCAILTSTGRQNVLLEQIVSRLSLEPGVSGVSWEIVAEQE